MLYVKYVINYIVYNLEQKGLLFEEIQEDSTSFDIFRQWAQITPLR